MFQDVTAYRNDLFGLRDDRCLGWDDGFVRHQVHVT
jgi:hypothetical protein